MFGQIFGGFLLDLFWWIHVYLKSDFEVIYRIFFLYCVCFVCWIYRVFRVDLSTYETLMTFLVWILTWSAGRDGGGVWGWWQAEGPRLLRGNLRI